MEIKILLKSYKKARLPNDCQTQSGMETAQETFRWLMINDNNYYTQDIFIVEI